MAVRVPLPDFALQNPLYIGATVQVWRVDANLAKTGTLATLYRDPAGATLLSNPQTLDSKGKWLQPVYVQEPVVMTVAPIGQAAHDTGVAGMAPRWRGTWQTGVLYFPFERITGPTGTSVYTVAAAHTSGTFATDLAAGRLELEQPSRGGIEDAGSYGVVGNGAANDTAALNAAIAAAAALGRDLYIPAGTYLHTASLDVFRTGMRVFGAGRGSTILRPVGNFDAIRLLRGAGAAEMMRLEDFSVDASGMTGGNVFSVDSPRCFLARLRVTSPFNGLYGTTCSRLQVEDVDFGKPRGTYGARLYTALPARTDQVAFRNINMGDGTTTGRTWDGVIVDGAVVTAYFDDINVTGPRRGALIQNTTGNAAAVPGFVFFRTLNVDLPEEQSVLATACSGLTLNDHYSNRAALTEGVNVGSGVTNFRMTGGTVRGAAREGLVIAAQDVSITGTHVAFASFTAFAAFPAVRVQGAAKRVRFAGALLGQEQGIGTTVSWGAIVESGAESIRFVGCDFSACLLGDVLDQSGGIPGNVEVMGNHGIGVFLNERAAGLEMGMQDGQGGVLTATVSGGVITGVTGLPVGAEIIGTPIVLAFDPAGTGANFAATAVKTGQTVTGITITNGGTGYSAGTLIVVRPAAGNPTVRARRAGFADVQLHLRGDGTGDVVMGNDSGNGFQVSADTGAVNNLRANGSPTTVAPTLNAVGADTNIDAYIVPKGTGLVRLGGTNRTATSDVTCNGHILVKTADGSTVKLMTTA